MVPLLGTEFVPKADFSEAYVNFLRASGLVRCRSPKPRRKEVEAMLRSFPRCGYTFATHQHRQRQRQSLRERVLPLGRPAFAQLQHQRLHPDDPRPAVSNMPGLTVTHVGLLDSVGGNKQIEFYLLGPDQAEFERLTAAVMMSKRPGSPAWWTWSPASNPTNPPLDHQRRTRSGCRLWAGRWQHRQPIAHLGGWSNAWRFGVLATTKLTTSMVRLNPTARTQPQRP
jgi:HAE1 family hydrophobic/amphiphilic exporter-1